MCIHVLTYTVQFIVVHIHTRYFVYYKYCILSYVYYIVSHIPCVLYHTHYIVYHAHCIAYHARCTVYYYQSRLGLIASFGTDRNLT